ncbi:hypothetical protein X975_08899, partial [Stegodyphus mimosarum]
MPRISAVSSKLSSTLVFGEFFILSKVLSFASFKIS